MLNKKIKKYRFAIILTVIGIIFVAGQAYLFSGYEAHVINVTAHICKYSETRTMGYWKNHPEDFASCLPTFLGSTTIDTEEKALLIFDQANAGKGKKGQGEPDMSDMLRGQLLAMKFNICVYGVGGYTVGDPWGTINDIVDKADEMLTPGPNPPTRKEMEEVKNILDYLNNLHQLKYCSENNGAYFAIDMPLEATVMGAAILENYCGDGMLYAGEECDDGNLIDGDGCDSTCMVEKESPPAEETPALTEEPLQPFEEGEGQAVVEIEQGAVGEVIETVGNAVETIVDVFENILGLSDENMSNEQSPIEENSIFLEEPIEPPIEIPPQPTEPPVTE